MALTTRQPSLPEEKQRNRRPKACRTCHARKVRCDYQRPCGTCVRRHHPQLCSYGKGAVVPQKRPSPVDDSETGRRSPRSSNSFRSPGVTLQSQQQNGIDRARSPPGTPQNDLLAVLDHAAAVTKSTCETDTDTGQMTFVGGRAHASVFRALLSHLPEGVLPHSTSVETVFGLTNRSISQPFVSLWNITARITVGDILQSLPSPENCLKYYRSYQQICHPFFPVVVDMEAFERSFCAVLGRLVTGTDRSPPTPTQQEMAADLPRTELSGYALLFAVLAAGCQSCLCAEDDHQLALATRVFVACSFECLGLANLYVNPSAETIQALLILASVNCNDGNPGVTMSILGMVAQQAQSLGMHTRCKCACASLACDCLETVHPLWRAIVILDARLSLNYDRTPISLHSDNYDLLRPLISADRLGYWDCLFGLHRLLIQWHSYTSHDTHGSTQANAMDSHLEQTAQIGRLARSDKSTLCRPDSVQATLEQLVSTIHIDFFHGTLHLQAALARSSSPQKRVVHFHDMASKFCSVISTYFKLQQLSPIARLAWEIIRAFKSSAIILAAFEVILRVNLSGNLLQYLAQRLSGSSSLPTWRDDPMPSSCLAGLETMAQLLRLRYGVPDAAIDRAK
jgi:hypothetical protein